MSIAHLDIDIDTSTVAVQPVGDVHLEVWVPETSDLVIGFPGPTGKQGPPGPPGADSTVPGPPGADSTVPGPPGEPGTPYDPAEADLRYVNTTGDEMTGTLYLRTDTTGTQPNVPQAEIVGQYPFLRFHQPMVSFAGIALRSGSGLKVTAGSDTNTLMPLSVAWPQNGDDAATASYVQSLVAQHEALSDPHPQYATDAYVDSRIWKGTQAAYDAIPTKDPAVLYVVTG